MSRLERIPSVGDTVETDEGVLSVQRMDGRRVDRIRYTPHPSETDGLDSEPAQTNGADRILRGRATKNGGAS
jgi:hypothetical protein